MSEYPRAGRAQGAEGGDKREGVLRGFVSSYQGGIGPGNEEEQSGVSLQQHRQQHRWGQR